MDCDDLCWLFESDSDQDMSYIDSKKYCEIKPKKRGRQSLIETHPELISTIKSFIEQSTSGAHLRRCDSCDIETNS